jgi:alkylation response protein AidB-like acyl-CoA dehydrogenase
MDMRLTAEQTLIQTTFARFFAERCSMERVRSLEEGDGHAHDVWAGLADLGALGMLIDEEHGGLGSGFGDVALICEAMGGALYPSPFIWTCVVAPWLIERLAEPQSATDWLTRIAAGRAIIALPGVADNAAGLGASPCAAGYSLDGAALFVEYAQHADALLCAAATPTGVDLFLIPRERAGLALTRQHEISGGQFYRVVFSDVQAQPGERLGAASEELLEQALDRGRVALAARMVGAAQRAFDLTANYLRERTQFGQPLLRFQALNFRLAGLLTRIDAARLLVYEAAWLIEQGQPFAHAALIAKVQAADVYRDMAAEAIQLHGGFGFTAEANPQLFYRRAAVDAMLLGTATALRERLAQQLVLQRELPM